MRIVVLGAGAMGSFFGGLLAERHEVTLVGRPAHMEAIRSGGLQIRGEGTRVAHPRVATRLEGLGSPDLLLLSVKSYDTRTAVAEAMAAGTIGPETRVLTLQNGLGNVEALQGHVAPSRLLAGATTIGVTFAEPGLIERGGPGYLRLGCPEGRPENAEPIAQLFREVGLPAEVADDCISEIWAKVVVNVAINPLAAITGLRNGSLLEIPALRALMERAAEEAIQVGRASGVALPDDVALRPRITAEKTAKNKSSMLQDIERGRRTEIDSLCGAIVKRGEEKGLDVSTNFALWALVQGIEQSTRLG